MFDFGNANDGQRQAISTTEGPVLITAGPGTGKTYTLVQRAIYLIEERGVKPEDIFIATFTEKAAKELITRITNELASRNITVNVNEMYVGTFHSLCLRIIKDHLEYTRLKKNYRLLDTFDQQYLVFRNIYKFRTISGIENVMPKGGAWKWAQAICEFSNNLTEEVVDIDAMLSDHDMEISVIAKVVNTYQAMLDEENLIDFSAIQTECYRLLKENKDILEDLRNSIKYIMVDEYQDTNYIQEQIIFLLGTHENICVVGDDDQGLYRFRGATIRNILEFPSKFDVGKCQIIPLVINYRSDSDIVEFYNKWMITTSGSKFKFAWDKFRYDKRIVANETSKIESPCVVKLASKDDEDEWHERVLDFINRLKNSGKIQDYNQLAFLFSSVKHERVISLARFLESNHINVYSPRSDMFFRREEVMQTLGCMMLMFPNYVKGLENGEYKFLDNTHYFYFRDCIKAANEFVTKPENLELKRFIRAHGKEHATLAANLSGTTDYTYSGLLYRLFMYKPFSDILDTDIGVGVVDIRPARNLAKLTQIIGKFEYLHNVDVLTGKYIIKDTELLFNMYIKLLFDGGIAEYEDDEEYAPTGCVSFLTIHQSKGMEFPVVFVDSLGNVPRKSYKDILNKIEGRYYHRETFEPYDEMKLFDFWRLYYTAFSRAQDLLVLTCNEDKKTPSKYIKEVYGELQSVEALDLSEFTFHTVKSVNLKNTFSFTSHIAVYETCALQYKFYKELEFMPIRQGAMLFGTLVHETIEDVHRAALRHETEKITKDNITSWFDSNYISLIKTEHGYLAEAQRKAALNQVLRYVERQHGNWSAIQQAEVDVSLVQPDYIIEGKIDLVKGENGTVELVDFKSEKKPDMEKMRERLEHYRRQLHIYAYLIEQRTGQKVSKMHLYYTGEENGNPMISFPYTKSAIDGTVAAFDDTVHKILKKDLTYFGKVHDTILVYKKGGQAKFNPLYTEHSEAYLKRFTKEENGRKYMLVPLHGPGQGVARNFFGKIIAPPAGRCWPVQSKIDELIAQNRVELTSNGTPSKKSYLDENNGNPVSDWWDDIVPLNPVASERTDYPTQKPEQLLERIVEAATNRGDLVFDCFMGSGTTQSVAMKLGRRFIGADINLGAIQTTTKRLINVASELDGQLQEEIKYTGFEVYNVNNYDFFRNPIEAKNLIIEALEVQPFAQGNVWDGELDGRMVKIMPVNRIATKADLEELKANLPYKIYEKRKEENPRQPVELITIICMGHEPDLKASLEQSLSDYKVDVQIVDILRDKSELQLKREAEAEVTREGNKLVIHSFYPMNLMQKLSLQKEYVEDWKQLVESIMIDWNYDGVVMQPMVTDVPDKKEFVAGIYNIPEDSRTIKVKITDLLSESLEVEV